ncbi:RDD family protein [Haloarcula sp. S1AR25-5A]|uniref:RDD family protein n=1 Tax=Haloarcula terrestris TaxID=2950533 RepID=A0AAE4JFB2_9EURY|nr:RDD family protein [Haloarcula terrestris]MDS0220128.1 RDD family protein [Haloarcula terrestris]
MAATVPENAVEAKGDRVVAYLIDFAILSAVAFGLWLVTFVLNAFLSVGAMAVSPESPGAMGGGSMLAAGLLGIVINFALWLAIGAVLVYYFGYYAESNETVGKRSQNVAVVDENGAPPSQRDRLVRTAVLLAPFPVMLLLGGILGGFGFLFALVLMGGWLLVEAAVMFVSDDAQRLGDRVAGTYVVSTGE